MKKLISLVALALTTGAVYADSPPMNLDEDTGIRIRNHFDAELLYKVPKEQGSWVAMAFDPKGRLIVSDQDDKGMFRVTLPEHNKGMIDVESLKNFPLDLVDWGKRRVGGAYGFVYAFDSLYMVTMTGFFRIRDTDGDDQYDSFEKIRDLKMGWEHSAHSVIKTEDGKGLYLISGNYGRIPDDVPSVQPKVWQMDSLLPMMPDAMGHASRIRAPGGWISRISPDGKEWKMVASGFRNAVDMAINQEGELFTYDSDLEFDIGCPWYRPTRINHVISGAEFGWRHGTAKWPEYSADSFGSVLNVGPGSPTGMSFGHHSNYPMYEDTLFICDWTFGTIFTVEMTEEGSSYTATKKEFLSGTPLNISAMRFGPDGAMYFVIGGRNTESALYRVRYTGPKKDYQLSSMVKNQSLRDLRHSLEALHAPQADPKAALDKAWPNLKHDDRAIRYAARMVIENQPLESWQERAFSEKNERASIYSLIALARHGDATLKGKCLEQLSGITFNKLSEVDQLALLRAYQLCFIRLDPPNDTQSTSIIAQLDPHYPATSVALNTELCRLLSYLQAPTVVKKTIGLMKQTQVKTTTYNKEMLGRHEFGQVILKSQANSPNVQNIQYAYSLRVVKEGWSKSDREYFFNWLNNTLSKSGGKSFAGHVKAIREQAIQLLTEKEAEDIQWLLGDIDMIDLSALPRAEGPAVNWTHAEAMKLFKKDLKGRDFDNGKKMFAAGMCVACHRMQGEGGYSGPDLGSVAKRYSVSDILTAIVDPSNSISEQYQASEVLDKAGTQHYGRLIYKDDKEVALAPSAFKPGDLTKIPVGDVKSITPSNLSMMPPATINSMNAEELKDLMAYLLSGGDKNHKAFQK